MKVLVCKMKVFFMLLLTCTLTDQKKKKTIKADSGSSEYSVTEKPEKLDYYIALATGYAMGRKKKKKGIDYRDPDSLGSRSDEEFHEYGISDRLGLDMNGKIRQYFAITAALTTPTMSTVCSPLSVLLSVAKIALGASGQTKDELLKAIGVSESSLARDVKNMLRGLQQLPGVRLNIASTIFLSLNYQLDPRFWEASEDIFKHSVTKVDFNNPADAANAINAWIMSATDLNIQEIIKPAEISPSASVIVVNAIYFKGKWEHPFDKTSTGYFFGSYQHRPETMMHKMCDYFYGFVKELDAQVVEIPYAGQKSSLVIILPKQRAGISKMLQTIKDMPQILDNALHNLRRRQIKLTIPKFTVESEWDLNVLFEKLHMKKMFSDSSELTRMVKGTTVKVSRAKQKAIIIVDEYGTTAAATTGFQINFISALPQTTVEFKADHPFLYMVTANRQQLFVGVYN